MRKQLLTLEKKWLQKNVRLLRKDSDINKLKTVNDIDAQGFIKDYRDYNAAFDYLFSSQPGAFRINDIWLSIPPEQIMIQNVNGTIDLPVLRSRGSIAINTGSTEVMIMLKIFISDIDLADAYKNKDGGTYKFAPTLESELVYKVMPLIEQLRHMPFCHIENEYIRKKITDVVFQGNRILPDSEGKINAIADEDIMFTYIAHRISTVPESPRIVELDLSFLLFNYHPFMHRVLYPVAWKVDERDKVFSRNENNTLELSEGRGLVPVPSLSLPFYQFHAERLHEASQRFLNSGYKNYSHRTVFSDSADQNLLFKLVYNDYISIPTSYISEEMKAKIEKVQDLHEEPKETIPIYNSSVYKLSNNFATTDEKIKRFAYAATNCEGSKLVDVQQGNNRGELSKYGVMWSTIGTMKLSTIRKYFGKEITEKIRYETNTALSPGDRDYARTVISKITENQAVAFYKDIYWKPEYERINDDLLAFKIFDFGINAGPKQAATKLAEAFSGNTLLEAIENANKRQNAIEVYRNTLRAFYNKIATGDKAKFLSGWLKRLEKGPNGLKDLEFKKVSSQNVRSKTEDLNSWIEEEPALNATTAMQKEVSVSEKDKERINKVIKSLIDSQAATFIKSDNKNADTIYVRIARSLPVYADRGLSLALIEIGGGHDIPRIPIGGYTIATHQYMGGYSGSVTMHLVSAGTPDAEIELQKIQAVMHRASANARQFKSLAAMDGVDIQDNGFLNGVCGIRTLVAESIEVATHPEIPNGSNISIRFSDFTNMKQKAVASLDFGENNIHNKQTNVRKSTKDGAEVKDAFTYLMNKFASRGIVFPIEHWIKAESVSSFTGSTLKLKLHINTKEIEFNDAAGPSDHVSLKEAAVSLADYLNQNNYLYIDGFIIEYEELKSGKIIRHEIVKDGFSSDDHQFIYNYGKKNSFSSTSFKKSREERYEVDNSPEIISLDNFEKKYKIVSITPTSFINEFNLKFKLTHAAKIKANKEFKPFDSDQEYVLYPTIERIAKFLRAAQPSAELFVSSDSIGKKSNNLTEGIKKWFYENADLVANVAASEGYTLDAEYENTIKEGRTILIPAYPDFEIPPSIDPDFYFFSPYKDQENQSLIKKNLSFEQEHTKSLIDRYKVYSDALLKRENQTDVPFAALVASTVSDDSLSEYNYGDTLTSKMSQSQKDKPAEFCAVNGDASQTSVAAESDAVATNIAYSNAQAGKEETANHSKAVPKVRIAIKEKVDEKKYTDSSLNASSYKTSLVYADTGDLEIMEDYLKESMAEHARKNKTFVDFRKAFPTYKIFIIEEDESEFLYPFVDDFNDYFGINAIQEIRLVQHSDQPADLLVVRFVDMTGKYSSEKFKRYGQQESKDPKTIDLNENPLKGLILTEGTCIQLRAGYTNDVNELPILFNGKIVSIEGETEFTMMCQSYGYEMVADIKYPGGSKQDITTFNAETKEILSWCLDQPELKHFGRWKLDSMLNYQASDSSSGLVWEDTIVPRYQKIRPDGKTSLTWTWVKNAAEFNVCMPEESKYAGLSNLGQNIITEGLLGNMADALSFWKWPYHLLFSWWTSYYVGNQTLWEIVDEMTLRYPGTVAKVLPFEDRVTLYVGNPDGPYFYREPLLEESIKHIEESKKRKENDKEIKRLEAEINSLTGLTTTQSLEVSRLYGTAGAVTAENVKTNFLNSNYESLTKAEKDKLSKNRKELEALKTKHSSGLTEAMKGTTKIFRGYHRISSSVNLIKNHITADSKDVHTELILGFNNSNSGGDSDAGDSITLKMNDMLEEEDIRSMYLAYPNCNSYEMAYRYSAELLRREAKKLYKGSVVTIGMPEVKPMDIAFMFDHPNQVFGPMEVRRHVLTIAPGEGMISDLEPGMLATVRNIVTMSMSEALNLLGASKEYYERNSSYSVVFGQHEDPAYSKAFYGAGADEKEQENLSWLGYRLGTEQGVAANVKTTYAVGTGMSMAALTAMGIGAAGLGGVVGAGTVLLSLPMGFIGGHLAFKMMHAAQYRNPIILHPMTRMGVPYLYGMNTYKNLGLLAWHQEKLKVLVKDVESARQFAEKAKQSKHWFVSGASKVFLAANEISYGFSSIAQSIFENN